MTAPPHDQTPTPPEVTELRRALMALRLEVPKEIADSVLTKAEAALRAQREAGVLDGHDLIVRAVAPFLRPPQIRQMPPFFRDLFMEYGAVVLTEAPDDQA